MNFLKKLFGKSPQPAKTNAAQTGQTLTTVIPSQEAKAGRDQAPYPLIQSVITYVNAMMNDGRYRPDELPPKALDAYYVDYYLAQVNNGGHSQFTHNAGQNLSDVMRSVLRGLEQMQAAEHLEIAQKYADWLQANTAEAATQTGFDGGRAAALDDLDTSFFALGSDSLIAKNSAWIASWDNVTFAPEAEIAKRLQDTAALNPHRAQRRTIDKALGLRQAFQTPMSVGFSLAAWQIDPPRPISRIGGGAFETIDGEQQTLWTIGTLTGQSVFGLLNSAGVTLFERIEHSKPPNFSDPEAMKQISLEDIQNFKAPERGEVLAQIDMAEVTEAMALCDQLHAADAVVLLERALGDGTLDYVHVKSVTQDQKTGPVVSLIAVLNGNQALNILVRRDVAAVFDNASSDVLTRISADQIAQFSTEVTNAAP